MSGNSIRTIFQQKKLTKQKTMNSATIIKFLYQMSHDAVFKIVHLQQKTIVSVTIISHRVESIIPFFKILRLS